MQCATCHVENPDTAKFCNECGAALEPTATQLQPPPPEPKKRGIGKAVVLTEVLVADGVYHA
jgi:hypothetical protein